MAFQDPIGAFLASEYFKTVDLHPVKGQFLRVGDVNGKPTTFFCTKAKWQLLASLVPRPGDVVLATYMKSGTTLTQEIFKLLLGRPVSENPLAAAPWIEIDDHMDMISIPIQAINGMPSFSPKTQVRFWKSHWWPQDHCAPNGVSKYITVARNGLDVCLSMFHHFRGFEGYGYQDGTLDDFFEKFMLGTVDFGSWFEHVGAWWKRRNDDDVLFLWFEDLISDKRRDCIQRIAEFVGLPQTDEQLDMITHETAFDQMKLRPLFYDMVRTDKATKFMRSGKAGEGKQKLSAEQVARFEQKCKEFFVGDLADVPWQRK